jgi:hypothetical protein
MRVVKRSPQVFASEQGSGWEVWPAKGVFRSRGFEAKNNGGKRQRTEIGRDGSRSSAHRQRKRPQTKRVWAGSRHTAHPCEHAGVEPDCRSWVRIPLPPPSNLLRYTLLSGEPRENCSFGGERCSLQEVQSRFWRISLGSLIRPDLDAFNEYCVRALTTKPWWLDPRGDLDRNE